MSATVERRYSLHIRLDVRELQLIPVCDGDSEPEFAAKVGGARGEDFTPTPTVGVDLCQVIDPGELDNTVITLADHARRAIEAALKVKPV
jgi:hypothetical protein